MAERLSMFDKEKGLRSKTQIWEESCNRPKVVCSRPDAILNMEKVCRRSSTARTSLSMVRTLKP